MPESQKKEKQDSVGCPDYVNKNCWLAKNVNHPPSKRCQYCELRFNQCLFSRYLLITLILVFFIFLISYLVERDISRTLVASVFVLVLAYGYFFNKSTETIVEANFAEKKAKEAFKDLTSTLKQKVTEQTKDINQKNKDITEKSQYLQELLEMKSDFLRVVNHQLNTPLSIIKSAYAMVKEGTFSPKKGFDYSAAGLKRLDDTIHDFWDAYELEGNKMKMNPAQTDIGQIVNDLVKEKQKFQLAQERKIKILVKKPDFKIPLAWCDPKKIVHVISNLLDNAIYYTQTGSVTVNFELSGGMLKVNVVDTGTGISETDKKRLFQKFSRGVASTNLHPDGSGLGLYIAKKIVEGNDGELTCFSEGPGKGSTFSFTATIYTDQKPVPEGKNDYITMDKNIIKFKHNNKNKVKTK
ncbi:MAG: HAMP domain-containing sensor histidine kinase [Patescibacteria group bacterium]|jgi:signal transduction histidine kinase